ncbi:MAG: flagellar basal body-associated FliL family protein [Chloroflexota bacterium]
MKGKKAILLLGIPLGLGVAAALIFLVVLPMLTAAPKPVPDPEAGQHGYMIPLDTKVVNLAPDSEFKYAKVGVTIELRPETKDFYTMAGAAREPLAAAKVKEMAELLPVLDDAVAKIVAAKTSQELTSAAGRDALHAEILEALRKAMEKPAPSGATEPWPPEVIDIYFTDLVMQ